VKSLRTRLFTLWVSATATALAVLPAVIVALKAHPAGRGFHEGDV
jgi:hypothetical protein